MHGLAGAPERVDYGVGEAVLAVVRCRWAGEQFEVSGGAVRAGDESDGERVGRGGSAVFDGEHEVVVSSRQVRVIISKSVQITRPSEGLSWLRTVLFAGVVDEDDGGVEAALELAHVAKQPRDFACAVLVLCDPPRYVAGSRTQPVTTCSEG